MAKQTENLTEQQLIQRAANAPTAFQQLYDLYFERVYAYVAAKVANVRDAEDLTADVFLQAMRGIGRFRSQHASGFAAWLFTIARNATIDLYRRQGRTIETVALDDTPEQPADIQPLEDLLITQEYARELRAQLDRLPERRREVLMLRYFSGLRNHEIAQVLAIDERTVAVHIMRGLRSLHAAYIAQSEDVTSHE